MVRSIFYLSLSLILSLGFKPLAEAQVELDFEQQTEFMKIFESTEISKNLLPGAWTGSCQNLVTNLKTGKDELEEYAATAYIFDQQSKVPFSVIVKKPDVMSPSNSTDISADYRKTFDYLNTATDIFTVRGQDLSNADTVVSEYKTGENGSDEIIIHRLRVIDESTLIARLGSVKRDGQTTLMACLFKTKSL